MACIFDYFLYFAFKFLLELQESVLELLLIYQVLALFLTLLVFLKVFSLVSRLPLRLPWFRKISFVLAVEIDDLSSLLYNMFHIQLALGSICRYDIVKRSLLNVLLLGGKYLIWNAFSLILAYFPTNRIIGNNIYYSALVGWVEDVLVIFFWLVGVHVRHFV